MEDGPSLGDIIASPSLGFNRGSLVSLSKYHYSLLRVAVSPRIFLDRVVFLILAGRDQGIETQ